MTPQEIDRRLAACARICEGVALEVLEALPTGALQSYVAARRVGLTFRQRETLKVIVEYTERHSQSPTIREIEGLSGIRSRRQTIDVLNQLEARGWIRRKRKAHRSITLIGDDEHEEA